MMDEGRGRTEMITIDDVAGAVLSVLAVDTGFAASVPGQAWFDRAPDTPAAYPYAVFHLRAGAAGPTFEAAYVQPFTLAVAAYVPQSTDAAPADPAGVQEALFDALATQAAEAAFQAVALRNASERIMHCRPVAPAGQYAPQLRDGRDLFACGLTVEMLVQGDRSVS
jgi:hypothetical protein